MLPLLLSTSLAGVPMPAGPDAATLSHWHDGRAELNGYRLTQPRYGQAREGTVVLVYVTEPFSESDRVKAENPNRPASDVFDALKLNVVKDFQTGVYDYNVMTSVFVQNRARKDLRAGAPTKLTMSMQEWCGMVFEELLFDPDRIRQERFSYFDGEGTEEGALEWPKGGITVDELPILVRGIHGDLLEPGESVELPLLPSLERTRLRHRDLAWKTGTLARGDEPEKIEVPAGAFEVEVWTAELAGERYRWFVEAAFPNRLVAWEGPDGERGELTGSARMKYWQRNGEGDERHLKALGLPVP